MCAQPSHSAGNLLFLSERGSSSHSADWARECGGLSGGGKFNLSLEDVEDSRSWGCRMGKALV